ncbi:MAG TPA: ABC transporter substrate-binding protein [Candidatus Hydrogenedentes bacterium]|nr:ABC transporter substrate-binding protein [Candidatus Hydrogenedentota bacterium]
MRRNIFLSVLLILALLPIAGIAGATVPAQEKEPIPIAMLVPITGASATEGSYFIKAADLAIDQINAAGGVNGQLINFIKIDNQSSNPGALNALNKAVNEDGALAILGPVKSTQVFAISDAVKEYEVPMIIGGTNENLTKQGNPWLFRCRPDDSIAAAAMVQYAMDDLGLTKIGVLHDSDAFGTGGADLVEAGVKARGLELVARAKYTTKDREFTAQLLALKNAGAEIMILYGTNPEDVSVIQRQYRQLNPGYLYLGSPSSGMKDALELSKEAAEGLLAIADYVPGQTEEARKYAADYQAFHGEPMDQLASWNYDSLMILTQAMRDAGVDWAAIKGDAGKIAEAREKIRQNMLDTQGYKGVLGTYSFSANGDGLHEVSVVEIHQDGNPTLIKVVQVGGAEQAAAPAEPVAADPNREPIPIAMLVPITGASATEGSYFIKAADLAIDQINAAGGVNGQLINFIKIDNQSSNPGALNALNKAVNEDGALAILGPVKSTQVFAISDAVKEYEVPMIIGGTNENLTKQGNPWLFRCRPDDSIAAAAMVQYAMDDLGLTKIGVLHDSDAFGTGGADLVEAGVKARGLELVARAKYTTKDREFTAQLLALKNAGAEIMILYGTNPEDVSVIQRQYRQLNPGYLYLGSPSSGMKDALELSKEAAEGLLAIADYVPGQTEEARKYAADYQAFHGEPMDQLASWNYDSLMILTQAMRDAGVDWAAIKGDAGKIAEAREKIRQNMLDTQGYKGVLGTYSFSANGDGLHEVSVVEIHQDGNPTLIKVVQVQ